MGKKSKENLPLLCKVLVITLRAWTVCDGGCHGHLTDMIEAPSCDTGSHYNTLPQSMKKAIPLPLLQLIYILYYKKCDLFSWGKIVSNNCKAILE